MSRGEEEEKNRKREREKEREREVGVRKGFHYLFCVIQGFWYNMELNIMNRDHRMPCLANQWLYSITEDWFCYWYLWMQSERFQNMFQNQCIIYSVGLNRDYYMALLVKLFDHKTINWVYWYVDPERWETQRERERRERENRQTNKGIPSSVLCNLKLLVSLSYWWFCFSWMKETMRDKKQRFYMCKISSANWHCIDHWVALLIHLPSHPYLLSAACWIWSKY